MAKQRVSNVRKKELEQIDPFQENVLKTIQYIKDHKKKFILAVCGILAVAVVFSSIIYNIKASENRASLLLAGATNKYSNAQTPQEGYDSVKPDFSTLLEKYPNTTSGRIGRVQYAAMCYRASEFEKAHELYTDSLVNFQGDPVMESLLYSCLGRVSLSLGKLTEAKSFFNKVTNHKKGLLKDEAAFTLAMIEEKRGDENSAKKFYERVITDHSESIYTPLAETEINTML